MPISPKRIVVINDRSAMVGGASNLAILSARFFERQGLDVTFFAGDAKSHPAPVSNTINLSGAPLVQQGKLSAALGGLYNLTAYRAMRRLVEEDDGQTIYHLHGWSKILSPSVFLALLPVHGRVVLHAHDYFLACPNGGFANFKTGNVCDLDPMSAKCLTTQCDKRGYHEKLWRTLRHAIRQQLFPARPDAINIVVVHEGMKQYLAKAGIDTSRTVTIRNPVEPFVTSGTTPWLKNSFFFIGRLEPEKGFADAARAARAAGATLHVIGDGSGRRELEKDFPEIVIHGWQERQAIIGLITQARAVIISSRVPEPFSLAAVEAVASGIPVIMPRESLIGPEIASLGCGLTFKSGDCSSLADAIRILKDDDELIAKMASNCRHDGVRLATTQDGWCHALLDLYGAILLRKLQCEKTGDPVPA